MIDCPKCFGALVDEHGDDCPECYGLGRVPESAYRPAGPMPTVTEKLFWGVILAVILAAILTAIHYLSN